MLAAFHILLHGLSPHGRQFSATILVISLPKCAYIEKQFKLQSFQTKPPKQGKVMHWKLLVKLHDLMTFLSHNKNMDVALLGDYSVHEKTKETQEDGRLI